MKKYLTRKTRRILGGTLIAVSFAIAFLDNEFIALGQDPRAWFSSPVYALFLLLFLVGFQFLTPPPLERKGMWWGPSNWTWLSEFFLAAIFVIFAVAFWPEGPETDTFLLFSPWIPLVIIVAIFTNRLIRNVPWIDAISAPGDLEPRDERERAILERATNYSFGLTLFLLSCLMTLFLFLPVPSQSGLLSLLATLLFFLQGSRGFLVWIFRRRTA